MQAADDNAPNLPRCSQGAIETQHLHNRIGAGDVVMERVMRAFQRDRADFLAAIAVQHLSAEHLAGAGAQHFVKIRAAGHDPSERRGMIWRRGGPGIDQGGDDGRACGEHGAGMLADQGDDLGEVGVGRHRDHRPGGE